ncbi:MAG: hypothetical protein GX053_00365 [Tissierella sp.]|nr:hypothetical protein [Tissierella sp.]
MLKRHSLKLSIMIILIMVISAGCSNVFNKNNKIAYIFSNTESIYQKTFEELNLGIIFDFNLRLPNADKSWVEIWVEGYSDGEMVEPFPITGLSYGLNPKQVVEGSMGFGIINPNIDEMQFLFYSPDANTKTELNYINNDFFIDDGISGWGYAINNKMVELESGEEKLLAIYRQAENQLRTYDYQDPDSINKMINEDKKVLLLIIKVEEIEEKD